MRETYIYIFFLEISFFEIFEVDQPEHPFDEPVDDDPRPNDALLVVDQAGPV